MTSNAASFVGNIPHHYDGDLGPVIFVDYAADMARRVGARPVSRVLETAAGTGIVSRQLRDVLPANAQLTATDLNPPMVEVARTKFQSSEKVDLRSADAMALPFKDGAFDAVVCQFGVMFFPDRAKSYQTIGYSLPVGAICSTSGTRTATIRSAGSLMKLQVASSPLTLLSSTTYRSPIIRSIQ